MELLSYLLDALTFTNLALALVGVILGTIIGALPGLSATMAVAVLVPFTFTMNPASGLIALGAIYTGAIYGGAYAAILVNTPGTPSAIATTFDGYPMAQKGEGGLAVTLATLSSVVGGIVGALGLLFLAPPLAKIALKFGPTEYFWLAIFGLTLISALSVGNTLKGLIGACIGLMLSFVGVAVVGGDVRYTMGLQGFLGGIDVVSALIGLYCVPVIIDLVATKTPHLQLNEGADNIPLKKSMIMLWQRKWNAIRSSIIGTVVGILPGAGGSIAGLVSYSEARRSSKNPNNFGHGEPDGIIATESANNATVGGGFIPTLVLGIPGTPPDAIILGALLVQGIKIGPTLFTSEAATVYTFIYGLLIATVLMLPVGLLIGRYAYKSVISFPKAMLVPTVAFLTVIGSFAIHSNIHDTQVMLGLGFLAWILNRYGFKPSPIVLGLILGSIAEQGFVQSYLIGNASNNILGMFFGRPISIGIIIAASITLLYPFYAEYLASKSNSKDAIAAAGDNSANLNTADNSSPKHFVWSDHIGETLIAMILVILSALAWRSATDMTPLGSVFPKTISLLIIVLSVFLLFMIISKKTKGIHSALTDQSPSTPRRLILSIIFSAWVTSLSIIGFGLSSLIAFIVLIFVAEHEPESITLKTWMIRIGVALFIVLGFYWLMSDILLLRIPTGIWF